MMTPARAFETAANIAFAWRNERMHSEAEVRIEIEATAVPVADEDAVLSALLPMLRRSGVLQ